MISPADATPSVPCDAQPEIAGLRTYASDKNYEATNARFFWLCGQGGYGIQTADGMARLAEGLLLDGTVPIDLQRHGLREEHISPTCFHVENHTDAFSESR